MKYTTIFLLLFLGHSLKGQITTGRPDESLNSIFSATNDSIFQSLMQSGDDWQKLNFTILNPYYNKNHELLKSFTNHEYIFLKQDTLIDKTTLVLSGVVSDSEVHDQSAGVKYSTCLNRFQLGDRLSLNAGTKSVIAGKIECFQSGSSIELYWANLRIRNKDFLVNGTVVIQDNGFLLKPGVKIFMEK